MTAPSTAHPGTVVASPAGADRAAALQAPSGQPPARGGQSALSSLKLPPALGLGGFSQPLSGQRVRVVPSAAQHHQPSKPARERIAGQVMRCKLRHSPRAALDLSPPLPATAVGACARLGACMWRAAKAAGGPGERQPGRTNAAPVAPAT